MRKLQVNRYGKSTKCPQLTASEKIVYSRFMTLIRDYDVNHQPPHSLHTTKSMFISESHIFDELGGKVLASAYLVIATKLHFPSFIASKENALKSDLSPEKQL
jgi:hypothetical protein